MGGLYPPDSPPSITPPYFPVYATNHGTYVHTRNIRGGGYIFLYCAGKHTLRTLCTPRLHNVLHSPGLLVRVRARGPCTRRCRKELIAKLPPGGVNRRPATGKTLPGRKPERGKGERSGGRPCTKMHQNMRNRT